MTEETTQALLKRFVNLGENCEFGLVQRQGGAEPVGLMRFTLILCPVEERIRRVTDAINAGFAGIGAPDSVHCVSFGGEWMIKEDVYHLFYHTFRHEGVHDPEPLRAAQAERLVFLRRKLLAELAGDRHIFVWKQSRGCRDEDVLDLHAAIRRHGARALLWVTPHDALHPPGTVEAVGDGLMRGYVTRLAPEELPGDYDYDGWLAVARTADRLWREAAPSAAAPSPLAGVA